MGRHVVGAFAGVAIGKVFGAKVFATLSRSAGTSGSAFSLIVSEADVCWMNTCKMPARIALKLWQRSDHLRGDQMETTRAAAIAKTVASNS